LSQQDNHLGGLDRCRLFNIPSFSVDRGMLTVIEAHKELPFLPRRVFWISGVPQDKQRGGHAHRTCDELVICLQGSVQVILKDGQRSKNFRLENSAEGLYLPPMVWIDLFDFSEGSIVLALASLSFMEADYIRDWDAYISEIRERKE
jgi:dTDP-4-dehydrorhamnose 3,5-epimerase-like enzyme